VNELALLQGNFGEKVQKSVNLAQFTSFRIGGPAKYFLKVENPTQLIAAYNAVNAQKIRYFLLGGGSNIVFADEGYDGLVIKDECREYCVDGNFISAQSGVSYNKLVDIATENSLTGLEYAAGIPGTIAGALWGNAGAWGVSIANILESAVLVDPTGQIKIVDKDFFDFEYRHSRLKIDPHLVVSIKLRLASGEKAAIADKVNEYRQLRHSKHPTWEGSAGSVFKNIKEPVLIPAGKLLEEAGVRGMRVGGAEIFEKHCNIVVNKGKAKAAEVKQLIDLMREKVLQKFNRQLELEITFIGP
jgi:UDP-N-acetylmuramate dehydrogenase